MEAAGKLTESPRGVGQPGWALVAVILLGLLLHVPGIRFGFFADDHSHQLVLDGTIRHPTLGPGALYDFGAFSDQSEDFKSGALAWWTSRDWTLRFFRPLTSWSLTLDHALYGRNPLGYHITNFALYTLLLFLAHRLYVGVGFSRPVALLALLLFAVTDDSMLPVGWLANRNSLLEVLFTVSAVLVVVRHGPSVVGLAGGFLFALAACLAKESGVVAPALVALALAWRERRDGRSSLSRAGRYGAVVALVLPLAYVAGLLHAGYGARSVFYATPWTDPLAYGARLGILLATGSLALMSAWATEIVIFQPELLVPDVIAAVAIVVPIALIIRRQVARLPAAGFFALWMLVSVLPQAGTPPSGRLLFGASIGSSAILALFLSSTLSREARPRCSRSALAVARLVALCALLFSPLALLGGQLQLVRNNAFVSSAIVQADVGEPSLGQREAFLLQSPTAFVPLAPLATWLFLTGDRNVRFWPMQFGRRGLRWTRVDERTFDLESLDEPFLVDVFEGVLLSSRSTPPEGSRWQTALFNVEALRVDERGLRTVRIVLDRPLDEARLRFLTWRDGKLRAVPPPRIGETSTLATVPRLSPFMP